MTDLLAEAPIQQLNLGYDSEQDRLMLKVGLSDKAEVSVWLTRRVVKTLWFALQAKPSLGGERVHQVVVVPQGDLQDPMIKELIEEALEEVMESKPALDFTVAYEVRTPIIEHPILANSCELVHQEDGQAILEIGAKDGKTIRMLLNVELMLALTSMLQFATKEAVWDLGFSATHLMMPELTTRPVLH